MAVGLAMLLVQGCATVPHEGRTGLSRPDRASFPGEATLVSTHWSTFSSEDDERAEAEARRAEVEWALARMWEVASGEAQVGTVWKLTFWVERGAFTLLSQRRGAVGGEAGQPAKAEDFTEGLRGLLTLLAETRTGALVFTLHRERSRWRVDYGAASMEEPPEARKHPARRTGATAGPLLAVQAMTKQVVRLLQVPAGASARMTVELTLEDDRLAGWKSGPYQAESGGRGRPADARAAQGVAVGTALRLHQLGPPPAQIPASGATALGSHLGSWRRIAFRAKDVGFSRVAATCSRAESPVASSAGAAGFAVVGSLPTRG